MKKSFPPLKLILIIGLVVFSCSSEVEEADPAPKLNERYILSVDASEGGSVNNSGGEFTAGTSVALTANPNSEYVFVSWSNGSTENPITVEVSSNLSLTANFEKRKYPLTLIVEGEGTVSQEIINTGKRTDYVSGATVRLIATPSEGWIFRSWSGAEEGEELSLDLVMDEAKEITAVFQEVTQYTLMVTAAEGGTVSSEGGTYEEGTEVTITAISNEGYAFTSWEGIDNDEATLTVVLTSDTVLTALFEAITQYTVTVNSSEGGIVSSNGGTFIDNSQFNVTATPNEGYEFIGWEQNDLLSPSLTITVTSNLTLTPVFSQLNGPTLWRGNILTFSKPDGADPNSEAYQDRIRDNVWITRGNNGGQLFNIALNSSANKIESPVGTRWAMGTLDEIDDLVFDYFRNTVNKPKNVVGKNLVLHLIEDDIYLAVKFTSWSNGKRGGFSYERNTP